jgi:hypothetical protein
MLILCQGFANDPYLSGSLAAETVEGVQDQGVITSLKVVMHMSLNHLNSKTPKLIKAVSILSETSKNFIETRLTALRSR